MNGLRRAPGYGWRRGPPTCARGSDSLAAQAQTVLGQDPFSGHVFCFRGRRGDLVKLSWWDCGGSGFLDNGIS